MATKADASDVIYGELAGGNLLALNVDSSSIISVLVRDIYRQIRHVDSRSLEKRSAEIVRGIEANRANGRRDSLVLADDADALDFAFPANDPQENLSLIGDHRPMTAAVLTDWTKAGATQLAFDLFG